MSSPITVSEDAPLEEAARVMIDKGIGCLPVMHNGDLVGIITETDIFKAFLEVLGSGDEVLRITLQISHVPGELARMTGVIADLGGNLHSVASFRGEAPEHVYITFRLDGVEQNTLVSALEEMGEKVLALHERGMSVAEIARQLFGGPMLIELLTMGHFSRRRLVLSYLGMNSD